MTGSAVLFGAVYLLAHGVVKVVLVAAVLKNQLWAHPWTIVWVNKLFGDARNRWDAAGLTDPRVVHLWDADDVSGGWLAANVAGSQGSDWDTYLLFGPEATWTSRPGPLRSSGSPVDHQIDDLRQALAELLDMH